MKRGTSSLAILSGYLHTNESNAAIPESSKLFDPNKISKPNLDTDPVENSSRRQEKFNAIFNEKFTVNE